MVFTGGCFDETQAFTGSTVTGAMTYSFIQAMENERSGHPTYGRLLNTMRSAIQEAKTGIRPSGPIASLANRLIGGRLSQVYLRAYTSKLPFVSVFSHGVSSSSSTKLAPRKERTKTVPRWVRFKVPTWWTSQCSLNLTLFFACSSAGATTFILREVRHLLIEDRTMT